MNHRPLARKFAALGNEVRLRIVELISAHKEMCVCELVDELGMSQANISRHVSVLRDAGILRDRKFGAWVLLSVDEAALEEAFAELVGRVRDGRQASGAENVLERLSRRCEVSTKVR
ncbi:MAG: ArsR/SmtB family transcription factor [Armatimonadota bacterium]